MLEKGRKIEVCDNISRNEYLFFANRTEQTGENSLSTSTQPEDGLGVLGISRSTTSSPVPQSMQSTAWTSCRRMIYIKSNPPSGHWPVPESFWPDPSMQTLVNRTLFIFLLH